MDLTCDYRKVNVPNLQFCNIEQLDMSAAKEKLKMKTGIIYSLTTIAISLFGMNAFGDQTLKCADRLGNTLEFYASKHIRGKLTLKSPSTGELRQYKIDIGSEYGGSSYSILAASPAFNGHFYFNDDVTWDISDIKSVSFHAGEWGWAESIHLSFQCAP